MAVPAARVTLLTPTCERDYERFCLQRESMRRCGIRMAHVAVVDRDDMRRFARVPDADNLTVIPSDEVLPSSVLRRFHYKGQRVRRWLGQRPLAGWHVQQLIKLAAPDFISTPAIVCLDSDAVFLRHVGEEDFFGDDGRLHLYETAGDLDPEMAGWVERSKRFLGVEAPHGAIGRFTHVPVPIARHVLIDLRHFVERRHGVPWHIAIDPSREITEYATYGVFAKCLDQSGSVVSVPPRLSVYVWWARDMHAIDVTMQQAAASAAAKILTVQSSIGVPPARYRHFAEAFWPRDQQRIDLIVGSGS